MASGSMSVRISGAIDIPMAFCALILMAFSVLFIYSSGVNSVGVLVTNEHIKQIVWAAFGILVMSFAALSNYSRTYRHTRTIYAVLCIALVWTLLFGRKVNGARSWLGVGELGVQPSELGKAPFILCLARYLADTRGNPPFKRFIGATALFSVPALVILSQPDLGTASVYIPIYLVMCFMADIPFSFVAFIAGTLLLTIALTIAPVWNDVIAVHKMPLITALSNIRLRLLVIIAFTLVALVAAIVRRYFHGKHYFTIIAITSAAVALSLVSSLGAGKVLKTYQLQRLAMFMNPEADRLGAGWNIINSKIAIGSGGPFGRGYLMGTQSHYRFLPQQSTDFIFSIYSEETGFIGGVVVFALYATILFRMLYVMRTTSDRYGLFIVSGIFAMFSFHFFINVGMVMGIMPITGIPLLLMSYGGSSLWSAMLCIGLTMSVRSHQLPTV